MLFFISLFIASFIKNPEEIAIWWSYFQMKQNWNGWSVDEVNLN